MKRVAVKKLFVFMFLTCMAFAVVGCKNKNTDEKTEDTSAPVIDSDDEDTELGSVLGFEDEEEIDESSYTYHLGGNTELIKFNPHEREQTADSCILDYTTTGLYDFIYSENKDGYIQVPEMAAEYPVDITSEYAGNELYGVPSEASEGYAYKVALREDACWENGDPINADTYIYSMQQLLNPDMVNDCVDQFFVGNLSISNAKSYQNAYEDNYSSVYNGYDYEDIDDLDMYFSFTNLTPFFGSYAAKNYYENGYANNFIVNDEDLYVKYTQEEYVKLTDESKSDLIQIAASFNIKDEDVYKLFCFYKVEPVLDFSKVGMIKSGDYEITFVLDKPIEPFYFMYSLKNNWIVYEELYDGNKKTDENEITKTIYGTSMENYISYGPYKLVYSKDNNEFVLERNEKWYGYYDEKHKDMWKTTHIVIRDVESQEQSLALFLEGKLDGVSLSAEDMNQYRASDYIQYIPLSLTAKVTFNTDYTMLKKRESKGVNKTIASYKEFRNAFSLCIDRQNYVSMCNDFGTPGFTLYNHLYIYDYKNGLTYRNSEEGKAVLCSLYGVEQVDGITGYDKEAAAELFEIAYEKALDKGDISEKDIIELDFHTYSSDESYVRIIEFFQTSIDEAVVGTVLENRIKIHHVSDLDYLFNVQKGEFDMSFAVWGGSGLEPYKIMKSYTDESVIFEYGFKPQTEKLTIQIDEIDITKTYYDWYVELNEGEYASADIETRLGILAAMELAILEQYHTVPIYYYNTACMYSQKVIPASEEYNAILGYGGLKYMDYAYNDEEWEKYCKELEYHLQY